MRRHEDDLTAEHQAGAAGAGAAVHAPGLELRPPTARGRRRPETEGRGALSRSPDQDGVRGQAGTQLGRRGKL